MSKSRQQHRLNDGGDRSPAGNSDAQSVWRTPDELKSFESKLAKLRPRDNRLDRDLLVFMAGQASAERSAAQAIGRQTGSIDLASRSATFWFRAFAGMTAIATTLLAILLVPGPSDSGVTHSFNRTPRTQGTPTPTFGPQASQAKARHTLSSAPYRLEQLDPLLAECSFERPPTRQDFVRRVESKPSKVEGTSPKSIPMLLKEATRLEFRSLDPNSPPTTSGANS